MVNEVIRNTQHAIRNTPHVLRPAPVFGVFAFFFLLLFALFTGLAAAQTPRDAEVDFYIKPREESGPLTVGDQVQLRLEVTHPSDSKVALPQIDRKWGDFEVIDQTPAETIDNEDGMAVTGKDITVTVFKPGRFQTPPLVVTHRRADGSLEELAAPVVQLRITSVLTEEATLHDLKPQAELPVPPLWPYVTGGLLLTLMVLGLLAGGGLWLYHRWQRRLAGGLVPVPFIDTRPPEVIAQAELDRIEALQLPLHGQVKEHYSLVDTCLRRYIEGRYNISALEQTTDEIRAGFRQAEIPMRSMSGFMNIFSESDLVKFARYAPQPDEVNRLIGKARAIVAATTPAPEPVAPPAEVMTS